MIEIRRRISTPFSGASGIPATVADPEVGAIYALNAGLLQPDGERLVLPSLIQPGWILRLPAPASSPSGNGHLTIPPAPVTPAAGRTPRPGPEPSAAPQRPVHNALSPAPARHHTQPYAGNVVVIPWGGLIGAGLAGAVTGALVLAGVQRRRRYQPARIITPSLEPGAPAPPLIGVLRRASRPADTQPEQAASLRAEDAANGDAPSGATAGGRPSLLAAPTRTAPAQPPGLISLGLRDGQEITADIAALGGLGLTGPGATAAARALLLAILSHAQPGASTIPAEMFVPAADAAMLIPGSETAGQPGLTITGTLSAALDHLEAAVLTRVRITTTATTTTDASPAEDSDPSSGTKAASSPASPPGSSPVVPSTPRSRTSSRSAAVIGAYGRPAAPRTTHPPASTSARSRTRAVTSPTSRDLPPPASAPTSTTCGNPPAATSSAPSSTPASASRPTSTGLTLRADTYTACQPAPPHWAGRMHILIPRRLTRQTLAPASHRSRCPATRCWQSAAKASPATSAPGSAHGLRIATRSGRKLAMSRMPSGA